MPFYRLWGNTKASNARNSSTPFDPIIISGCGIGSADPALGSAALGAIAEVSLLKCVPSPRPAIPLCGITSPQRRLCSSGETPKRGSHGWCFLQPWAFAPTTNPRLIGRRINRGYQLDQIQFSGFATPPSPYRIPVDVLDRLPVIPHRGTVRKA